MDSMILLMEIIMTASRISQQLLLKINSFLVFLRCSLLLKLHNLLLLKCISHSLIYSNRLQPNLSCNSKCQCQLLSNFNQPMLRHPLILDNSIVRILKLFLTTSILLYQILILDYDQKCLFIHQLLNKLSLSPLIHSLECKHLLSHSIKLLLSSPY